MTRRMTKTQRNALGKLLIFGVVIVGIGKILDATGFAAPLIICIMGIGLFAWYKHSQKNKRIEYLRNKYADEALVQRILRHEFWQAQTSEQLADSLGNPDCIDRKVLKAKTREIWKYDRRGVNRYKLRITLDEDIVVGWDEKA